MNLRKLLLTSITLTLLTGLFAPVYAGNLGALVGAVGGAAVGSTIGKGSGNVAAIAVGTLLGAGLGSIVEDTPAPTGYVQTVSYAPSYGYRHDHANYHHHYNRYHDRHPYYHNYYYYPYSSYTSYWVNPAPVVTETVAPVVVSPAPTTQCREFTQTITVGGRIQQSYGTACLQPDGSWQMQP